MMMLRNSPRFFLQTVVSQKSATILRYKRLLVFCCVFFAGLHSESAHAISGETKTAFNFISKASAAHFRSDGLLIDLGVAARHKYTLGNNPSGWQGDYVEDGTTYSNIVHSVGRVSFFAAPDETDVGVITIRGRSETAQYVTVLLNGAEIGIVRFSKQRFSVTEVSFENPLFAGMNLLELRPSFSAAGNDDTVNIVSVDYIKIIPNKQLGSESIASSETQAVHETGSEEGILLLSDQSVTYNLFVPEGATLELEADFNTPPKGEVEIEIESDSLQQHYRLLEDATEDNHLEIDLRAFSGNAVSIRFTADGEDTRISRAVITQPKDELPEIIPKAKNVLVLLIDTLRSDRLRLYNRQSRVNAPYLSRLGAESVVFEAASAPSNWTKPSVATLLTGVSPKIHGANTHNAMLNSRLVTASEHFQKQGFNTAGFVANGYISSRFGFGQGWNFLKIFGGVTGRPDRAGNVVENAVQWLQKHPKKKRFFMYVHTIDPHAPYVSPKKYQTLYDRFFYRGFIKPKETAAVLNAIRSGSVRLSLPDKVYLEALYDSEITYLDEVIGHLMRMMRKLNLLEDTLVILTSDHGEEFFEHGSVGHGHSLYEELLRVPLVIRLPGQQHGGVRRNLEVGLSDVMPTMCQILQTPCPNQVQGKSLVPAFSGDEFADNTSVSVAEFPSNGETAIRKGRFKAIFKEMTPVLYDLSNDPRETTDVSTTYPVTLAALLDSLGEFTADETARENPSQNSNQAPIDEESEAGLKALGYLGD